MQAEKDIYEGIPEEISEDGRTFKRVGFLGKGAFGEVFKYEETSTGMVYAAKFSAKNPQAQNTLLTECLYLKQCSDKLLTRMPKYVLHTITLEGHRFIIF